MPSGGRKFHRINSFGLLYSLSLGVLCIEVGLVKKTQSR